MLISLAVIWNYSPQALHGLCWAQLLYQESGWCCGFPWAVPHSAWPLLGTHGGGDLHSSPHPREWTKNSAPVNRTNWNDPLSTGVYMKFAPCRYIMGNRNCWWLLQSKTRPSHQRHDRRNFLELKKAFLHVLKLFHAQTVGSSAGNGRQTLLGASCYWEEKRGSASLSKLPT